MSMAEGGPGRQILTWLEKNRPIEEIMMRLSKYPDYVVDREITTMKKIVEHIHKAAQDMGQAMILFKNHIHPDLHPEWDVVDKQITDINTQMFNVWDQQGRWAEGLEGYKVQMKLHKNAEKFYEMARNGEDPAFVDINEVDYDYHREDEPQ